MVQCFGRGTAMPQKKKDLSCSTPQEKHWFCSACLCKMNSCPLRTRTHQLCTGPRPRKTEEEYLSAQAVRSLSAQNNLGPHDPTGGSNSRDVEWLAVMEEGMEPLARPPWHTPQWRVSPGEKPHQLGARP